MSITTDNLHDLLCSIQNNLNVINGLEKRKKVETDIMSINQLKCKLNDLNNKLDYSESYANFLAGADRKINNIIESLESKRNSVLDVIRIQTQLYFVCNDIKEVIGKIIEKYDPSKIASFYENLNTNSYEKLGPNQAYSSAVINSTKSTSEFYQHMLTLNSITTEFAGDQNRTFNDEGSTKLDVNYSSKKIIFQGTILVPLILLLATILAFFSICSLFNIDSYSFPYSVYLMLLIIPICIGILYGWTFDVKKYGKNHLKELKSLEIRINNFSPIISHLSTSFNASYNQLTFAYQSHLKGLAIVINGLEKYEVSLRSKARSQINYQNNISSDVILGLNLCIDGIEKYFGISEDKAWQLIEMLKLCKL